MIELLGSISNYVGITGVIMLLIAFLLLSTGRLSSHSLHYQWVNFLGAALILFSLYFHWNLSSVVIEIAWMIISVIGIFRILRRAG